MASNHIYMSLTALASLDCLSWIGISGVFVFCFFSAIQVDLTCSLNPYPYSIPIKLELWMRMEGDKTTELSGLDSTRCSMQCNLMEDKKHKMHRYKIQTFFSSALQPQSGVKNQPGFHNSSAQHTQRTFALLLCSAAFLPLTWNCSSKAKEGDGQRFLV